MDFPLIDSVVVPSPSVAWAPIDDQVVVHRLGARRAFAFDRSASILWQCLDGDSTIGEVLADVADVAGAPLAVVVEDSLPVVQSWLAEGIAALVGEGPEHELEHEHEHEHGRRWRRLLPPPNG